MSDRSPPDYSHAAAYQLSPAQWAVLFTGAWLVGWVAIRSYMGMPVIDALTQAVPMAIILGSLAYVLRR